MGFHQFSRFTTLFILVILVVGCRQDKDQLSEDTTVYIRLAKDPERLNPIMYPVSVARPVNQNIFMPMADFDPFTYEFEPLLIEKIPTGEKYGDKGIKYDIHFIKEATWTDGFPINGEDYLTTLKIAAHPLTAAKSARSSFANISKVEIDPNDNKHLTVFFDEDYALALETATSFELLPAHIYDPLNVLANITLDQLKDTLWFNNAIKTDSTLVAFADQINSQKYSRSIVDGAGPYQLIEWIPEEAIVLKRKENYWAKDLNKTFYKQIPKTIIFKIIPDEVSAIAELKAGLLDFIPDISAESYSSLKQDSLADSRYSFYDSYVMKYYFLPLNTEHPVLKSKAARQALAYATNVDQYIEIFEKGMGQPTVSFVNPSKKYYNTKIKPFGFDLDKSRALLAADGWMDTNKNGIVDKVINGHLTEFKIEMYASGNLGVDIGLLLKEDAAKAGMDVEVIKKDYSLTKQENLATGNYGMMASMLSQSLGMDDPYLRFHSDNATLGGNNYALYKNNRVDELCMIIKETSDEKKLKVAFDEIQEIIYDDQPFIFLYVPKGRYLSNKKWKLEVSPKRPGFFPNTFESVSVLVKK